MNPSIPASIPTEESTTPTPKRKRKSRWSDAPSSEDQKIAVAMSSFTQQPVPQISAEQQQQLLEQQEVSITVIN